jgi:hypothetical protein
MITIALAEDHHLVRQGFKLVLSAEGDFKLVGEAADGLEAVPCRAANCGRRQMSGSAFSRGFASLQSNLDCNWTLVQATSGSSRCQRTLVGCLFQ